MGNSHSQYPLKGCHNTAGCAAACFICGSFSTYRRKPCSSCKGTQKPSAASMLTTLTSHWSIMVLMKPLRNCEKPLTRRAVLHSGCLSPGFTKLAEQGRADYHMPSPAFGTPFPFKTNRDTSATFVSAFSSLLLS